MEKVFSLFFILLIVGCTQNEPLYNYDVEKKINEMGFMVPEPSKPIANYVPAVSFSESGKTKLVYVSGTGPKTNEGTYITGKVDQDLTIEEGYDAAKLTALNILGSLKGEIGDLNKVVRFVKVIGMVNSTPSFNQQPAVINGFSDFIVEVFGDRGRHARSAVGLISLPSDIAVEIEVVVEVLN